MVWLFPQRSAEEYKMLESVFLSGFKNYLIVSQYPTIFNILNPLINRILHF